MKINLATLVVSLFLFASCQKEEIKIGKAVSETFYVQNAGASMRVLVEGNTASKAILLFVHGGPGASSYFYNTDYISQNIEDKYAVAYWDQRNAGASQGNDNGGQLDLKTMTTDLKKVIQVLKHRYGQDVSVFILGHSFGGMLSASFVTTENNQDLIKGWIMFSGVHNYPLNDKYSREGLIFFAKQQIALSKRVDKWQEILDYCNSIPAQNISKEQFIKLNTYANNADRYFDEVKPLSGEDIIKATAVKQNIAITSIYINALYNSNANILNEVLTKELSSKLNKVTVPVVTMYGKYDLICPPKTGDDVYSRVGSTSKFQFIFPNSGHNGMFSEPELFCREVNKFIEQFR